MEGAGSGMSNHDDYSHIQVIDTTTGEVLEDHPRCARLEDQIEGLQRDIRGWAARYAELKRDKVIEAKQHPRYDDVEAVFREWKRVCNHPRSPFTADRFWLALPFIENPKYGVKMAMRAVAGAAHDAYEVRRKNGTPRVFNEWERIFKNAGSFEEFCCKAPIERKGGPDREPFALTQ